jgi:tetratricopeptide (TPR) repeat protein
VVALVLVGVSGGVVAAHIHKEAALAEARRVADAEATTRETERQKKAEEEKRAAREKERRTAEELRGALATRDLAERVKQLDALLAREPKNVRALVARGAATIRIREEAGLRGVATADLDASASRDLDAALGLDPRNGDALVERLRLASVRADGEAGRATLAALARTGGGYEAALGQLVDEMIRVPGLSPERSAAVVSAYPDRFDGWRLHGALLRNAGRLPEAVDAFARALEIDESFQVRSEQLSALQMLGDRAAMTDAATRAIEAWPLAPSPREVRARLRIEAHDLPGALEDARKLVALGVPVAGHELALNAEIYLGDLDGALVDCDALLALPRGVPGSHASARLHRAWILIRKDDLDGAMKDLSAAVGAGLVNNQGLLARCTQVATQIAERLLAERGDTDTAEAVLARIHDTVAKNAELARARAAIAIASADLPAARQHIEEEAQLLGGQEPPQKAELEAAWREVGEHMKPFDAAIARGDPLAHLGRAEILSRVHDTVRAREEIGAVLDGTAGAEARARALVARACLVDTLAAAAADLERALELAPELPVALAERAVVRAQLDQAAPARADGERAVALAPTDAAVHARRAYSLVFLGDLELARREARDALARDPACVYAEQALLNADLRASDRAAMAADLRRLANLQILTASAGRLRVRADYLEKLAR